MNVREKFLQGIHEMVHKGYGEHLIAKETEDRWLLRKPRSGDSEDGWETAMWTEVVCLANGGILVDGDVDPVVFRFGPKDPVARIHWMGQRKNAWDHYFREKACIGMGGRGFGTCLEEWRSEIAICDVEATIGELIDGTPVSDLRPYTVWKIDALRDDVIDMLRRGDCTQEEFCRELYLVLADSEDIGLYGTVPSHRMFTAHAALARLSKLLEGRS